MAHKVCTEEGTWFRHPQSNLIWSNYTTCVDVEDLEVRYRIKIILEKILYIGEDYTMISVYSFLFILFSEI